MNFIARHVKYDGTVIAVIVSVLMLCVTVRLFLRMLTGTYNYMIYAFICRR